MSHILELSDLQLARMTRAKNDTAVEVLNRVCPRVYQVVHMIVRSRSDADELVQMSLVEILEHLHQFRGDGSLASWAGQVTYRVVMRELVRSKRHLVWEKSAAAANDPPPVSTPEQVTLRRQLWEQLSSKLEQIPLKRRTTLLLHLVHDYTVPEVAELSGVSVNTVKDSLKIAYRELRTILAENTALRDAMLEAVHD